MNEIYIMRSGRQAAIPQDVKEKGVFAIMDWQDHKAPPAEIKFHFGGGFWPWPKDKCSYFTRVYMVLEVPEGSKVEDGILYLPFGNIKGFVLLDAETAMSWAKNKKGNLSVKSNYSVLPPSSAIKDNGTV